MGACMYLACDTVDAVLAVPQLRDSRSKKTSVEGEISCGNLSAWRGVVVSLSQLLAVSGRGICLLVFVLSVAPLQQ